MDGIGVALTRYAARVPIETARQVLRRFAPDDAPGMFALNGDPLVIRWVYDEPFESIDATRAFLERYQEVYRRDGIARLAAIDRTTGAFLGWCGLRRQTDGEVDLGYRYLRATWGRGLATEASLACLAYGFEKLALERIVGRAALENAASIRVLQKVGMRFEKNIDVEGHPSVQYVITTSEWKKAR